MSRVLGLLRTGRDLAWADLRPAFDHAIVLATEAEFEANRAASIAQTYISPAYPPLVLLLAESAGPTS